MARLLGVSLDEFIILSISDNTNFLISDYYHKLSPNLTKPEVSSIMIYADIVLPKIHVGGSFANLLDIVSVPGSNTIQRTYSQSLFKPIKHNNISSISIAMRDKDGDKLSFNNNDYTAIELEIREIVKR